MRVAIYARCSTNLGQRPEIQVDELKTIAKNRGWEVCYIILTNPLLQIYCGRI